MTLLGECGEYNIGGESAWSEGLKDGHFCGEKVDWVPPDMRVYSNAFSKLMKFSKGLQWEKQGE